MKFKEQEPRIREEDAELIASLERMMGATTQRLAEIKSRRASSRKFPGHKLVVHDGIHGCEFANGRTVYFVEVESYRYHLAQAIDEMRDEGISLLHSGVLMLMTRYRWAIEHMWMCSDPECDSIADLKMAEARRGNPYICERCQERRRLIA